MTKVQRSSVCWKTEGSTCYSLRWSITGFFSRELSILSSLRLAIKCLNKFREWKFWLVSIIYGNFKNFADQSSTPRRKYNNAPKKKTFISPIIKKSLFLWFNYYVYVVFLYVYNHHSIILSLSNRIILINFTVTLFSILKVFSSLIFF